MRAGLQRVATVVHGSPQVQRIHRTGPRTGVALLYFAVDMLTIFGTFYLVYLARFKSEFFLNFPPKLVQYELLRSSHFRNHLEIAVLMALFLVAMLYKNNLYSTPRGKRFSEELGTLANALFITLVFGIVASFVLQQFTISRLVLFTYIAALLPVLGGWRYFKRKWLERLISRGYRRTLALIVGAGKIGSYLEKVLQGRPELGVDVVGFLDDQREKQDSHILRSRILGGLADFRRIVAELGISDVYITIPSERAKVMRLAEHAHEMGVNVHVVPDLFDLLAREVEFESIGSLTMLRLFRPTLNGLERFIKRVEDLVLASLLLLVFSPVMAIVAVAIKLDSPGPVLYKQQRHGMNGKTFWLLKFRSMYANADQERHRQVAKQWIKSSKPIDEQRSVYKLTSDDRITPVGRFIRKFNLDELPQFWNVVRGEMSLVGPRPPLTYEYQEYQEHQKRRLAVKPGVTGLWQVSGLHRLSFQDMVLLDLRYINEWSLWLDLEILLRTIPLILFGKGA